MRCTPKRRHRPTIDSTRCTTRSTVATSWNSPTTAAVTTTERRGWITRRSRRSRRTAGTGGWTNWRKNSGSKRIVPSRSGRVNIPKDGQPGKFRPLGIPCIRDRVVQMATVLVLEPIFEADLEPEQHAYRPERSAPGRRQAGRTAAAGGVYGGDRRRLERVLRQHPPRRAHEIGGPAHQRRADPPPDQDVAGDAGGRAGRRGTVPPDDPEQGRGDWEPRKGLRSPRCWRISTCVALCGAGRQAGTNAVLGLASSTTRTTS